MVEDLQSRIAELAAEVNQHGPALAHAQKEKARLEGVEADLSRTIQNLRAELLTSQQKHSDELAAMTTAHAGLRTERDAAVAAKAAMQAERDSACTARDELRKERDELVAKYEDFEKYHTAEVNKFRRKARGFCSTMEDIDTVLSGKYSSPPRSLLFCSSLLY